MQEKAGLLSAYFGLLLVVCALPFALLHRKAGPARPERWAWPGFGVVLVVGAAVLLAARGVPGLTAPLVLSLAFVVPLAWQGRATVLGGLTALPLLAAVTWWAPDMQLGVVRAVAFVLAGTLAAALPRLKVRGSAVVAALLTLSLLSLAAVLFTGSTAGPIGFWAQWHHWSVYVAPAESMLAGAIPFRDFPVQYGVGPMLLVAGLCQWLAQQPFLSPHGFSWRGEWSLKNPGALRIGRLMLPTVFGSAIYQVNILLSTLLVSFLPAGSVTFLYYADRLVEFPLGVFGLAVSTAALPNLSQLATENRDQDFAAALRSSISLTLFIGIPAMAGLMALSEPVVSLLFGRGAFTPEAVTATSNALLAYSLGLPFTAAARPMASAFYALESTRTPVYAALASLVVNIGLGALLMGPLAHVGLALAVATSSVVNAVILCWLITRRLGRCPIDWVTAVKCLGLSALMGLAAHTTGGSRWLWIPLLPLWPLLYFGAARLAGLAEAKALWGGLSRRLVKKTPQTVTDPADSAGKK